MSLAILRPAFHWRCSECAHQHFIEARVGGVEVPADMVVSEHFETADVETHDGEEGSPYLVCRVAVGPSFVQCEKCHKMHATTIQSEITENDN